MAAEEVAPTQDIYLSVQEVYGASLPPLMHPRHPNVVAFATGPFIILWDWKADRKQVSQTLFSSCSVLCLHTSHVLKNQMAVHQYSPQIIDNSSIMHLIISIHSLEER